MKILVAVFRVVTPCSDVVRYQHFGGSYCFQAGDEGSKDLRKANILPHQYTASQLKTPRLEY